MSLKDQALNKLVEMIDEINTWDQSRLDSFNEVYQIVDVACEPVPALLMDTETPEHEWLRKFDTSGARLTKRAIGDFLYEEQIPGIVLSRLSEIYLSMRLAGVFIFDEGTELSQSFINWVVNFPEIESRFVSDIQEIASTLVFSGLTREELNELADAVTDRITMVSDPTIKKTLEITRETLKNETLFEDSEASNIRTQRSKAQTEFFREGAPGSVKHRLRELFNKELKILATSAPAFLEEKFVSLFYCSTKMSILPDQFVIFSRTNVAIITLSGLLRAGSALVIPRNNIESVAVGSGNRQDISGFSSTSTDFWTIEINQTTGEIFRRFFYLGQKEKEINENRRTFLTQIKKTSAYYHVTADGAEVSQTKGFTIGFGVGVFTGID